MGILPCYLASSFQEYGFDKKNLGVKVTTAFVRKLHARSVCITMIFRQKLSGLYFPQVFHPVQKLNTVFVCELSTLPWVDYQAIYTKVTGSMFSTTFFVSQKLLRVFVCELSALRFIYYHVVYTKTPRVCFQQKLPVVFFLTTPPPPSQSYRGICTWFIRFAMCLLTSYLYKSYRDNCFPR